jgi:Transposase DDE domain group 1
LRVMRDGRSVTVEVTADGAGLVSHAGSALLGQVADKVGLTRALSRRLGVIKQRRRGHDPGRVIGDLAVMLADGGECVSDLGAVREQEALFGDVASDSTAFRTIDRIAKTPGMLDGVRCAHAQARERFWELSGAPDRLTIDVDATLITSHSEKEKAAGNYKHGYGFHPLGAYADQTREALAMLLRPGNAGSNTAADHVTVIDQSLAQIPAEHVENIEILIRADTAGATHGTADHCRRCNLRFSFGYELTEPVRAAILQTPEDAWIAALEQDESERENGQVVEITDRLDLSAWPTGSRVIVRRERPHPGAQLGGFKWSSQRPTLRSCDAQEKPRFGTCRSSRDAIRRTPTGWASGTSGPVLGGDRSRGIKRGSRRGGGCVAGHWCPVVPQGWRDAASRSCAGVGALSVLHRAGGDSGPARAWLWGARDRAPVGAGAVDDLQRAATELSAPHRPA